jgi:hypothetical protein
LFDDELPPIPVELVAPDPPAPPAPLLALLDALVPELLDDEELPDTLALVLPDEALLDALALLEDVVLDPIVHTPASQVPPPEQEVPSALAGLEQMPVAGSQRPALWQSSCAMQVIALDPVQTPAWQVSG